MNKEKTQCCEFHDRLDLKFPEGGVDNPTCGLAGCGSERYSEERFCCKDCPTMAEEKRMVIRPKKPMTTKKLTKLLKKYNLKVGDLPAFLPKKANLEKLIIAIGEARKKKRIKAWAVICSQDIGTRAFTDKEKAKVHRDFLNEEYKNCCKHKVVSCEIKLLK